MYSLINFAEELNRMNLRARYSIAMMQVSIKNFDQLRVLSSEQEIQSICGFIHELLESCNNIIDEYSIIQKGKFFYCAVNTSVSEQLEELSEQIRNKIISDNISNLFLDIRITTVSIKDGVEIADIFYVLQDALQYSDHYKIFKHISAPEDLIEDIKHSHNLLGSLKDALKTKSARFAFQPVVNCQSGKIAYHECLLRINNDDFKLISAGKYVYLAEKYGFILEVDKYVFDLAMEELLRSQDVILSINISNVGVQNKPLLSHMIKSLNEHNLSKRLIIEITETAFNDNFEITKYFVDSLRFLGCKIGLDDFGAGYASFGQIRLLNLDIIKIDGSFIMDIYKNEKNRLLVETLIKTAKDLNCKTVAEFVDSGPVAKKLIEMEVDYMQGNFFSPALNYRSWNKE
ncbi:MAG: EAL domain-containing protein [Rickettsiaceae bacterium]|nr:EAL domain-containing protein [Rickettsiaceae bacterium]